MDQLRCRKNQYSEDVGQVDSTAAELLIYRDGTTLFAAKYRPSNPEREQVREHR